MMEIRGKLLVISAALATAASLLAGGFFVEIAKPEANPEAQTKHAVLVVRTYACVTPAKTSMSATAEGLVNGKLESIPLKLIQLAGPNTYAVPRQWPADGKWVVSVVATNPSFGSPTSAIVPVDGDTVNWGGVIRFSHAPTTTEIQAPLAIPRDKADTVASRF